MEDLIKGWHEIASLLQDDTVDELLINHHRSASLVRGVDTEVRPSPFQSSSSLMSWLLTFARQEGVRLDPVCGSSGGRISAAFCAVAGPGKDDWRWHALLPPLAHDGPLLAIRRHRWEKWSLADFDGEIPIKRALIETVKERRPLLIAGPTGSGKSTLLVALLAQFAAHERVMIFESIGELPALFPTWVRLRERYSNIEGTGAVPLSQLLSEALRLRPDRLILGEIRGKEAKTFHQIIQSGHSGTMATLHAGSVRQARQRFQSLAGMATTTRQAPPPQNTPGAACPLDIVIMHRGSLPRIADFVRASNCL